MRSSTAARQKTKKETLKLWTNLIQKRQGQCLIFANTLVSHNIFFLLFFLDPNDFLIIPEKAFNGIMIISRAEGVITGRLLSAPLNHSLCFLLWLQEGFIYSWKTQSRLWSDYEIMTPKYDIGALRFGPKWKDTLSFITILIKVNLTRLSGLLLNSLTQVNMSSNNISASLHHQLMLKSIQTKPTKPVWPRKENLFLGMLISHLNTQIQ